MKVKSLSRARLLVTPGTGAYQAPPSMGFSRQEYWSGLPFPSPMHESEKWKWSHSVVSNSCDPMDCSLPGSSVHGIFQARVLEWGAISITIPLYPTWSEVPTSLTGIHSSNLQVSGAWYVKSLRLSQCYFCPSAIYFLLDGQVIFTETNQHKVSHWPV